MISLKKILIEQLSGIAKYKEGTKEILTQNQYNNPITVEILDVDTESYILRRYHDNGQPGYQLRYQNGKRHGTSEWWYEDGQLACQEGYQNGELHGVRKHWNMDGKLWGQREYQNGIVASSSIYVNKK